MHARWTMALAVTALVGCNWLLDIEGRDPARVSDSGAPSDDTGSPACGDPEIRTMSCAGADVDVCSDRAHCGACGRACPDDPFVQCLRGVCHDHRDPGQWVFGEHPACTAYGDGSMTKDANTGLIWESAGNPAGTIAQAEAHCAALNEARVGGFTDWALPTRVELTTLSDFNWELHDANNKCAPRYKTAPPTTGWYCGRSRAVKDRSYVFLLRIPDGAVTYMPESLSPCRPRCVHATRPNVADRFTKKDTYVQDRATGLIWMELPARNAGAPQPEHFKWSAGKSFCQNLDPMGEWHLPTIKELGSIVDERRMTSIYDVFPDGKPEGFWSDTSHRTDLDLNYVMNFHDGGYVVFGNNREESRSVRCARAATR